jgi:hypothetical protein
MLENFRVATQLAASQQGLVSMEFVPQQLLSDTFSLMVHGEEFTVEHRSTADLKHSVFA